MIEAVKFWNEPNNKSHWDFENLDPDWHRFAEMVSLAGQAVAAENPQITRVMGGMSPISAPWIQKMWERGALAWKRRRRPAPARCGDWTAVRAGLGCR